MSTLSLARRRSVLPASLTALLLGAVPLLSGCGTSESGAPTKREYSVVDGAYTNAGNVVLRNLYLTADVGFTRKPTKTLDLEGAVFNNTGTTDTLTSVTAGLVQFEPAPEASDSAGASASAPPSAGSLAVTSPSATTLPAPVVPGVPLLLGTNGLELRVTNLPTPVLPGGLVNVRFTFHDAGSVSIEVPVFSLSSLHPGTPASPVVIPSPEVGSNFEEPAYDNASAAPSS